MQDQWEAFKVKGDELVALVRKIIREGNVRRIVVKQDDRTIVEFPVTVGVVGALAAPVLAALGGLAALLTDCTVHVERAKPSAPLGAPKGSTEPAAGRKKAPRQKRQTARRNGL